MRYLLLIIFFIASSAYAHEYYVMGDVDGDPIIIEIPIMASPLQGYDVTVTITPVQCAPSHEQPPPAELPQAKDNCQSCHQDHKPDKEYFISDWDTEPVDWSGHGEAPSDKGHKKHKEKACIACHKL